MDEPRLNFLIRQVSQAFRGISQQRLAECMTSDPIRVLVNEFLESPDVPALFVREAKAAVPIEVSITPMRKTKEPMLYFAKISKGRVSEKGVAKELIYGDVLGDPIDHMAMISERVYHPIVSNEETAQVWSEMIVKETRTNVDAFVSNVQITQGNMHGKTYLPLPSSGLPKDNAAEDDFSVDDAGALNHIHMLESAVIVWTKQIKNVLKQYPEMLLENGSHPGPMAEIMFWKFKSDNLNGIYDQLQSAKVRRVLKVLDKSKSTYNAPFAKICKEVFYARAEAANITKFLSALSVWCDFFIKERDFGNVEKYFQPIMHVILLVWKSSPYYNTPSRLVVLLREICNSLIVHTRDFLAGDSLLDLICAEDSSGALKMLEQVIRCIGRFKAAYFEYKDKSVSDCPDNPWRMQNNAVFVRLDAFLERCHDVLEMAETIAMFSKLAHTEVGGTKGKTLSTSVGNIFSDFSAAVDGVRVVGKGLLDLENKAFDEAFYEFRTRMKELDRRLGSVIAQALDDASTVKGKFRVLDSFENLVLRPIVADELEKKHASIVAAVKNDIEDARRLFQTYVSSPPLADNHPPIAGALTWSRGLLERVQLPMDRLKELDKKILERDDTRETVKLYTVFVGELSDFERGNVEAWSATIETSSQVKLKNSLLRRERSASADDSDALELLHVNFDPLIVKLLRESKYFILLGLSIPDRAAEIFKQAEVFRRHTGNLELIVNMYNDIQTSLLPVERPLVRLQLEKLDKTLSQGFEGEKGAVKPLTWKSNGIETFISEAMAEVHDVSEVVQTLQENLKQVEHLVETWKTHPLFERGSKTLYIDEFVVQQVGTLKTKLLAVAEGGHEIHHLMKDTNKRLKVSQGLPDWKSYVDFVNNVVCTGLVEAMHSSLVAMSSQFDAAYLEKNVLAPLLEIQMDLVSKSVVFVPEVGLVAGGPPSGPKSGIKNIVEHWIEGMFGLSSAFPRLDSAEGTYLREISEAANVRDQLAVANQLLSMAEDEANKIRKQFQGYDSLWMSDLQNDLAALLLEAVVVTDIKFVLESDLYQNDERRKSLAAGSRAHRPSISVGDDVGETWQQTKLNLVLFGAKVTELLKTQDEISEMKSVYEIVFLKVNAQPVKQAISTWVTKGLYTYTHYLQNFISLNLNDIYVFLKDTNVGLDRRVEAGQRETIMSLLSCIRAVRRRMPELSFCFRQLDEIVVLLKHHAIAIDLAPVGGQGALEFLELAKSQWEHLVNKAFRVKESLQPLQTNMLDGIIKEVAAFEKTLDAALKSLRNHGPYQCAENKKNEPYAVIDRFYKELSQLSEQYKAIIETEDLFELPKSRHQQLAIYSVELNCIKQAWDMYFVIEFTIASWRQTLWNSINCDSLLDESRAMYDQLKRFPPLAKEWDVFKVQEARLRNTMITLPLVKDLHSAAIRERHWKSVAQVTGVALNRGPAFALEDLLAANIHLHLDVLSDIVEVANKELKIETRLATIEEVWIKLSVGFEKHKETELLVIKPPDEILEVLDEHVLLLQNMAGMGKFVDFFREQVVEWQTTLGEVETNLKLLCTVTKLWASLESIFLGSDDIRTQLPEDASRFDQADVTFRRVMGEMQENTYAVDCLTFADRDVVLQQVLKKLEKCEYSLNEYLEVKKGIFPRFYFVSNAALLDILSNSNTPTKVGVYIGALFDGIGKLDFCMSQKQKVLVKNTKEAIPPAAFLASKAMVSKDKERIDFPSTFDMTGNVERWLNELVACMQQTLRGELETSMEASTVWDSTLPGDPREEWVFTAAAQICLLATQIVWTDDVEKALEHLENGNEDALKKYADKCSSRLDALIRLVQDDLDDSDRVKIINIITSDVHNRDVVLGLINKKVESAVDFNWQSQLRFYWDSDANDVTVKICDFVTTYSYEYIGNCNRLVITPLTDRCFVTLTVALKLFLGGAPAGPAGTGKTETTKDLSRCLGVPCYVFNCSNQMNYKSLGDIFKGLTQVGAWGCFDEFNRIEIEVLSVVASQVRCILKAIAHLAVPANRPSNFQALPAGTPPSKVGTFDFFGYTVNLIPTVGIFITMNPGYAGRSELPENLKSQFRSCAMVQPDFLPIAENMLMAEGFVRARPLSVKFVTLYKLSSELLSKQHHYDWGLRAMKSVLRVAGVLKRADDGVEEEAVLMRALRDFNSPKIPNNDLPIFLRLIADIFPGLDLPPKQNDKLKKTCIEVCAAKEKQPTNNFISKVIQFQELLNVRHSVVLLGPPGSGKTTCWRMLSDCHNFQKTKLVTLYETVNPKAVTTDELYGYMTLSKDWRDGIISSIMRNMSQNVSPYAASQTNKWVVLDGDIDAIWIESMNTVMDDNKMLTLVSNERIPLSDSMRMVFEVHSLRNATPATVSRAGILYINDTDIGHQPYVDSWLQRNAALPEYAALKAVFETKLQLLLDFCKSAKLESAVPLPSINMVQSLCLIFEGILTSFAGEKKANVYERAFLFAAMWAFGGALSSDKLTDHRKHLSTFLKEMSQDVKFPEEGTTFDYCIDIATGETLPWSAKLSQSSSGTDTSLGAQVFVATAESACYEYLLDLLVRNAVPVMFVGPGGTGKTVLVNDYLSTLAAADDKFKYAVINMNYYTDSLSLQRLLEQNVDKRSGKTYGPPTGKMIFFVDDLNLPCVETYGTQTPMALIRQHIDYSSWYDRAEIGLKKNIVDCQYVACMNSKSGSFFIDPRLQRHFVTFACDVPQNAALTTIYGNILSSHLYTFDKRVHALSHRIVDATIAVHKDIQTKFLPSAVKFYYNFTMRELSSVVRGLLNAKPGSYHEPSQIARLWYHEVMRVYADRLMTDVEVQRCRELAMHSSKRFVEDGLSDPFAEPCIFTNFISKEADGQYAYVACENPAGLKTEIESQLAQYNESNPIMSLVLFEQAVNHVVRICRIMFNGGSALFCGVGGSGKQSLSRLACFICRFNYVQLAMTNDYGLGNFKEDLRMLFQRAAVKPAEPIMFVLNDDQVLDERFLVCINDLLSSGRVADLFTAEEYDSLFASLRSAAKAEGVPDNRDSMMKFFTTRIKTNLHVVLCFSPVGEQFRQRARRFPGLFNCTSINWLHEWPKDALISVAQKFLKGAVGGAESSSDLTDSIAYHIAEVHLSVGQVSLEYLKTEKRYNYTTPKSFLELISFYKSLLNSRHSDVTNNIKRLVTGLDTLMRTNKDVIELQEVLKGKKVEVEAKKAATEALLDEMGKQRSEAEAQQTLADVEKKKADLAAEEARKLEEQAADDLAIAKPALDAANDAIHCLDKNSMTELKSFNKPPAGVDKVTAALLIMIKQEKKDFSWENAKKMMAKVDAFKERLETYRGEDIPEDVVARVLPFINDPDFTYEKMKSKSAAASNLCNWVINIVTFNGVYKRVKPLMESLEVASKAKLKAESDLAVVEEALAVIEGRLNKLQSAFVVATQEKAAVELEAKHCSDRLYLAERLTTGLHSERDRWSATVDGLRLREETLPGDVMLAAAFTSYVGAFSAPFRVKLWREVWLQDLLRRDVPMTLNVDPLHILTDESMIAGWQNDGLPADRFSFENGAILVNCSRWPLLIDPQLQGIKWLKRHEEQKARKQKRSVVTAKPSDPSLLSKLTVAIRSGDTLIVENIGETFDSALRSIIAKSVYRKAKALYIKIGDADVEYDENFRLYLQTKMSSPHYKPEIAANCTLINFIVTKSGLEDQLLAVIVSEEEPSLETTRNELVTAFNMYKIQLKSLEDNLLERLANAPVDILSDTPLIEGLEATKETADEVSAAVERGKIAEVGINEAREVYRAVAGEAALLYFIMLQLCEVDHMYQYSLDSFTKFFLKALKTAAPASEGAQRVVHLQSMLRWTIYRWVVRGLFERHRLLFLTQLCLGLLHKDPSSDEWGYSNEALRFLLAGPRSGEEKSPVSWLNDADWGAIKNLSTLDSFEKLAIDMEENAPRFLEWYQSFTPETEKLPGDYRELDKRPFLKLLAIRVLRPDRITAALSNFICHYIPGGKSFLECDSQLSTYQVLESSFEDSNALVPLYFLLSPGADIAANIDKLAAKMGKSKGVDYHNISLGQGQEEFASEKLEAGKTHGHWIFLDNVHLMPRWLAVLEKKLDEFAHTGTHPDFRVLLSSDPSENIPVAILNRCIKITSDPPTGMKPNLKQALASFSADTYNDLESRSKGILFGLCQFHAIMVERKKFGSKGFNMTYPFAIGDLTSSVAVLRNYMDSAPVKIPWVDLRYLFGEIMYGGHIINEFDRLVASVYLEFYMRDELLGEMSLLPFNTDGISGFKAPSTSYSYDRVLEHIEEDFSEETPSIFGLHPNAEIGYRTQQCSDLLRTMLTLSSGKDGSGLDQHNAQQVTEAIIQDILDNIRGTNIDIDTVLSNLQEVGPFQNFLIQECQRMNLLVDELVRSLSELDQGFRGDLMMSDAMERLAEALFLDRVPLTWESLAFPSLRNLSGWLADLHKRLQQLSEWIGYPAEMPKVVWISGLFNPQCFLTAVMQITSHAQGLELDKLTLVTELTKDTQAEDVTVAARDGTNIIGLFLEGAAWNTKHGFIDQSRPKQMFSSLPVINIKPAVVDKFRKNMFICPVYKTLQRGPTYVFSLQLRSNLEVGKWILAGVAAIMDIS